MWWFLDFWPLTSPKISEWSIEQFLRSRVTHRQTDTHTHTQTGPNPKVLKIFNRGPILFTCFFFWLEFYYYYYYLSIILWLWGPLDICLFIKMLQMIWRMLQNVAKCCRWTVVECKLKIYANMLILFANLQMLQKLCWMLQMDFCRMQNLSTGCKRCKRCKSCQNDLRNAKWLAEPADFSQNACKTTAEYSQNSCRISADYWQNWQKFRR